MYENACVQFLCVINVTMGSSVVSKNFCKSSSD